MELAQRRAKADALARSEVGPAREHGEREGATGGRALDALELEDEPRAPPRPLGPARDDPDDGHRLVARGGHGDGGRERARRLRAGAEDGADGHGERRAATRPTSRAREDEQGEPSAAHPHERERSRRPHHRERDAHGERPGPQRQTHARPFSAGRRAGCVCDVYGVAATASTLASSTATICSRSAGSIVSGGNRYIVSPMGRSSAPRRTASRYTR